MDDATCDEPSKLCTKCGELKPLAAFSYDRRHADGRQSQCRACTKIRQKRWKEADREHYLELKRQEHLRNREQRLASMNAYRATYRELLRQRARDRTTSLTDEELEARRARHRQASAAYLQRHPDLCAQRIRAWQRANPDKGAQAVYRRRAWKHGNGDCERFARTEIGERDGWVCWLCDLPVDPALNWPDRMCQSLDHVVPLSLGGTHTRDNSRIAHWICNVRRGAGRKLAA